MSRTRFVLLAAAAGLAAAGSPALAQDPPSPPVAPMPMHGYQGQWQGHWSGTDGQTYEGQWTGTYDPRAAGWQWGPMHGSAPWGMTPEAMQAWHEHSERCRDHRPTDSAGSAAIDKHAAARMDHECQEFWAHSGPPIAYPGGAYPMPYPMPAAAYPGYGYAPYGYVWVPVMVQKPCVETTTTTVTYVPETTRRRVIPRRHKYIREKVIPRKSKYIKE